MAVKDRTKPIQAVVTKSPAKYLGPQTLLGLTRHLVQVSCDGVLITAWLTDEDFEKGFENVPEPDKTYVNPLKAIRLRADAWTDRALERVDQVHCIVRCIRNGETWCDVKIMWKDGRTDIHPIKASDLYDAFENVPEESPVDIECDNGAAPEPHEGNGKAQPEIDWKGEVECRYKHSTSPWDDFTVLHYGPTFPDVVYGAFNGHKHPGIYTMSKWEFRNKPKPDPKWEAAMDGRPVDCQRKTLWQVWVQCPGVPVPIVVHTGTSQIGALGILQDMRDDAIMPKGTRFAIQSCKAPVMPEAAEVGA